MTTGSVEIIEIQVKTGKKTEAPLWQQQHTVDGDYIQQW